MVLWHPGLQQYPYAIDVPVVCHDRADNGRDQYVFILPPVSDPSLTIFCGSRCNCPDLLRMVRLSLS